MQNHRLLLERIRPAWISGISQRMAQRAGVRESFVPQLERFYDLLIASIESEQVDCLAPLLDEWVAARTQTEVEAQSATIPPILTNFYQLFIESARAELPAGESLELLSALLPVYTYAYQYTSRLETQDYIERISAELQKATQAFERLDKSKSDFIAVAAHELRTPLTLIEGYTSMLRETLPAKLDPLPEAYIKGIDTGSHRLREIIDDMIDVSMIDNNLLAVNFQPVWLNRLFVPIQREMNDSLLERKQHLVIKTFDGFEEMTYGDGERLLQAFRNLITNAVKYTPDGGKIVVDGRLLPGFIEVTVTDSGIGIDPEDHNRIFEKFGKLGSAALHSTSKTQFKGGGPGLGLPITKGIIEAHGGAIWVESEGYDEVKCPGSIFHVLLPLRKEPPDVKTGRLFRS